MIIQHIGTRALSLYISTDELLQLGLDPDALGQQEAEIILARALDEKRLDGWRAAELEVYPGREATLLFARRKAELPQHFLFSDFETLITAAHLCPDALPSHLFRVPGGFILSVYPFAGDNPPAVFFEFGKDLGHAPYLSTHLTEQQYILIASSAIAQLCTQFAPYS